MNARHAKPPHMNQPPRWADRLLEWVCAPHLLEEIQGDLHERYVRDARQAGTGSANRRYWLNVLRFMHPFALKRQPHSSSDNSIFSIDMFFNYIKLAWRQLWRNRFYSSLNVVGLSIGLSACWVIYRIVSFEFSFDTQNPDRDRIVRVVSQFMVDGKEQGNPGTPLPMADAVRRHITGIERTIPILHRRFEQIQVPQPKGSPLAFDDGQNVVLTDTNYFRMVPYIWLSGNPSLALTQPNCVVLTQRRAAQYFPGLSPRQVLNKPVLYRDTLSVQVVGVVADLPYPSDFTGSEFVSIATDREPYEHRKWGSTNSIDQLFLMLSANADPKRIEEQINALSKKNSAAYLPFKRWHLLQPLAELHFGTAYNEHSHRIDKHVLVGLIGLACFILALAVINYINLASAQVPQRAREIGIRKTLGSRRRTLVMQFLGETAAITLLAFGLAYGLSQLFFANFSDLIPDGLTAHQNWLAIALFLTALLISVTLLAGLYPGWLIARFQPAAVLRGQLGYTTEDSRNPLTLRKSLIVFQFFIAQLFIVGSLIVNQQLRYSLQADMGFVREAVLTVSIPWKRAETIPVNQRFALKQALKKLPGVSAVSLGNQPASDSYSSNIHELVGKKGKVEVNMYRKYVDTDYIPLYKLPLLAGRNLQPADTIREYVINETAAKALGFNRPQEALGAHLREDNGQKIVPIVGVVRDFHTQSFREKIQPTALMTDREGLYTLNIKLASNQPADWQQTITQMNTVWKQFFPDAAFDYEFYDQTMEAFYKQDRQLSRVVNLATAIAILISCLGLFGLATLTAHQRTKEIGIRKVLGASIASVVSLLSKDFIKLVLIAVVLASPLAWWAVTHYLQRFTYRINVSVWIFVGSGLLAVLIALLTVSYQSIRAALMNPVKSLQSE